MSKIPGLNKEITISKVSWNVSNVWKPQSLSWSIYTFVQYALVVSHWCVHVCYWSAWLLLLVLFLWQLSGLFPNFFCNLWLRYFFDFLFLFLLYLWSLDFNFRLLLDLFCLFGRFFRKLFCCFLRRNLFLTSFWLFDSFRRFTFINLLGWFNDLITKWSRSNRHLVLSNKVNFMCSFLFKRFDWNNSHSHILVLSYIFIISPYFKLLFIVITQRYNFSPFSFLRFTCISLKKYIK